MNKKYFLLLIVIFAIFFALIAYQVGTINNNSDLNDNDTFVVGFDEYAPLAYINGSEATGFELELAQEIARRNNWSFAKKNIDWIKKDEELDSGKIDCFASGFNMNGREENYTWLSPYLNVKQVAVVKSDSNISNINDLDGKGVELLLDSSLEDYCWHINNDLGHNLIIKQLNSYKDDNGSLLNDVKDGVVDAIIMDQLCANHNILDKSQFKIVDLYSERYSMAFKLGNYDLRNKVQKTLDQMYKDGTVMKIAEKYEDYDLPKMIINKTIV